MDIVKSSIADMVSPVETLPAKKEARQFPTPKEAPFLAFHAESEKQF